MNIHVSGLWRLQLANFQLTNTLIGTLYCAKTGFLAGATLTQGANNINNYNFFMLK